MKGEPAVLIHNGQLNIQEITRNHIEMEQLRTMLRQQQCFSLANAKYVVLENAGQISVLTHSEDEQTLAIMLVDQGNIQYPVLQSHHLSETWLREELQKQGYSSFKKSYLCRVVPRQWVLYHHQGRDDPGSLPNRWLKTIIRF